MHGTFYRIILTLNFDFVEERILDANPVAKNSKLQSHLVKALLVQFF